MSIANVQSITAGLAPDSQQVISGVAIGVGDVTRGLSGDRKVWRAEELREAAASLEGTPINPLHSQQEVGEVVRAGFDAGRGVIYEAELDDEKLAEQAANGRLEVSIEARHADGGTVETDRGEAMLATDIQFTGMAMVQHGAAPSATADAGQAAALSPADIRATLAQTANLVGVNGEEIDLSPPERVVNAAELGLEKKSEIDDLSDCGTGVGEAIAEAIVNDDLTPEIILNGGGIADNGGPTTYLSSHAEDAPDDPPTEWSDETWRDGCGPVQHALWGHYLEWFEDKAAELRDAMETSEMGYNTDEDADLQKVPDEYIFDNPGEAVSKTQDMGLDGPGDEIIHTHGEGDDTRFMPAPSHSELMDMLDEDELAATAEFDEGDLVRWSTSASPGTGRVAAVVTEPGETVTAEGADVTREATEEEPAYKLDNYVGPEAGYDDGVVVKSASEILGAWDDAPEEAEMATTDDAISPETGQDEDGAGGEPADGTVDQTDDFNTHMTEKEEQLRARLSEKEDRIAELESEVEQLQDEREDVALAYADALAAGDSILDEDDLVEKFTVAELSEKFEQTDEASLADAEPAVQSGSGGDSESAALSDSEQKEVAKHREALVDLDSEKIVAQKERERRANLIAETTGEDPETILEAH